MGRGLLKGTQNEYTSWPENVKKCANIFHVQASSGCSFSIYTIEVLFFFFRLEVELDRGAAMLIRY